VTWDWEAPPGAGDVHQAVFEGTRARLEIRQAGADSRELRIVPRADIGAPLAQRVAALQPRYPGVAAIEHGDHWQIAIPDRFRLGHDRQFVALMRAVLAQIARPEQRPAWEAPNLLAKYALTTGALALAARS
jgi:hypothetical protein